MTKGNDLKKLKLMHKSKKQQKKTIYLPEKMSVIIKIFEVWWCEAPLQEWCVKNIAIAYIRIWNGIVFTVFIHSYISNDQHSGFNSRSKTNRITVCDPLIISYTVSTGGRSDSHGYHPVSCLTYFQLTVKLLCLFRSYVIHWFTFNQHGLNDKKNNDMVNLMLVWDKCMNAEKHYSWFIQWILVEDRTDKQRRAVPFKKFGRRHPTSDF